MLLGKSFRRAVIGVLLPVLAVPVIVHASGDWHHGGRGGPPSDHWRNAHHGQHGTALGLGLLLGGATVWFATQSPPRPRTVYVAPPPTPLVIAPPVYVAPPAYSYGLPPPTVWYYCRDAGAYYPQVPSCRTPWELVPRQ